jgi:hypothetical protein
MLTDGWNQLLYDNFEIIPELLNKNNTEYNEGLYGNGNACNLITDTLKKYQLNCCLYTPTILPQGTNTLFLTCWKR